MSNNLMHATLVELDGYGVLLTGKSAVGKSDLALRLIENKKARLVADDVVELKKDRHSIFGRAPQNLRGLLEVRGVGVVCYPHVEEAKISLMIRLTNEATQVERMPKKQYESILGLEIPQIDLYAKENSAPDKIMVALKVLVKQELQVKE